MAKKEQVTLYQQKKRDREIPLSHNCLIKKIHINNKHLSFNHFPQCR